MKTFCLTFLALSPFLFPQEMAPFQLNEGVDRLPIQIDTGIDNTGDSSTGRQRIFWKATLAQDLSYQYTTSVDFHHFQKHTGTWKIPLTRDHFLQMEGSYTTFLTHSAEKAEQGKTSQISGRYTIPLPAAQEFSFGFDYKNNNKIEEIESYVNLSQFVLKYKKSHESERSQLDIETQGFYSPGRLLRFESANTYAKLRPAATAHYVYGRALIRYEQKTMRNVSSLVCLKGQISSALLLPSEQLSLGGHDTVRGYEPGQLTTDNGILASGELKTPPLSFLRQRSPPDALQFLAFIDYGWGRNHERKSVRSYLLSIGPGLRYTVDPYLVFRFDYGFKLHQKAAFKEERGFGHFRLTASY